MKNVAGTVKLTKLRVPPGSRKQTLGIPHMDQVSLSSLNKRLQGFM
jgi:hypothetical protein